MNIYHIPEGLKDIYGEEFRQKKGIQERIHAIFNNNGYEDISTPTLEYFDVFSKGIGATPSRDLYKFYDREGNTCVLRPDFTPSIARCVAKYFSGEACDGNVKQAIRLTYEGNTFSETSHLQGKLKESTQMGIELIGEGDICGDLEAIRLAILTLLEAGLQRFVITIGHMDYFRGLCQEQNFDSETQLAVRKLVSNKNFVEVDKYLTGLGVSEAVKNIFISFDSFMGGYECLKQARQLATNNISAAAIERLSAIYEGLDREKLSQYVVFDLSLLPRYHYYTGVVFSAYAKGVGDSILKGGRYDRLLWQFGVDRPAIGFCVMIDDLCQALNITVEQEDYLTVALTKGRLAGQTMKMLAGIGITCEELTDGDTRKLIFENEELKLRFFLSKGPDVPTYVENGAADIGVTGEDIILEENRAVLEVLDLGFGRCRMCVCGPESGAQKLMGSGKIRVATKYPVIAKDYFLNRKNQTVEFIKLNGSVELGPIVGLSDVIVDIVETGSTLRENGLEVLEEILPISARLIVNPVSMQLYSQRIKKLINDIKEHLDEKNKIG